MTEELWYAASACCCLGKQVQGHSLLTLTVVTSLGLRELQQTFTEAWPLRAAITITDVHTKAGVEITALAKYLHQMQSFAKEVFIPTLQEGKLSPAKHTVQISNSGVRRAVSRAGRGALCSPVSPCPRFLLSPALTANSTERIHCSQLVPGHFVRHCVRSSASLLEVKMLILKPVEGAEGQGKALGQVGT